MNRLARATALLLAFIGLAVARAVPPLAAQDDCVTIDDFTHATVGEFPADWTVRDTAGRQVYTVQEEGGLRFLHADSAGFGIQAAREFKDWDLTARPVLAWAWRPRQFPKDADERESRTNDSALAVYMFVPYSKIRGPKALKYIWSEKVPVGTHLTSNGGLTQVSVLRSGTEGANEWQEQRVNVLKDYQALFRETEAPRPAGIGVLTDADDTQSRSAGDYARFRACRA